MYKRQSLSFDRTCTPPIFNVNAVFGEDSIKQNVNDQGDGGKTDRGDAGPDGRVVPKVQCCFNGSTKTVIMYIHGSRKTTAPRQISMKMTVLSLSSSEPML